MKCGTCQHPYVLLVFVFGFIGSVVGTMTMNGDFLKSFAFFSGLPSRSAVGD